MSPQPFPAGINDGFTVIEQSVSLSRYRRKGVCLPLIVLSGLFQPDEWSDLTLEAAMVCLDRVPEARRVHDVGSGSGVVPLVLNRLYPDRGLVFGCCDIKPEAERNLQLNHFLFGGPAPLPGFHLTGTGREDALFPGEHPPDLVVANIPQLPAPSDAREYGGDWNPDDYHCLAEEDLDDPVRAFGLGLLADVLLRTRKGHSERFCAAFCRSSRVPQVIFDAFLERVGGRIIHLGHKQRVPDGSTPYSQLASAEDRFGCLGVYHWRGDRVPA